MNKMIKASPVLASIMRSIRGLQNNAGRTQASQLTANGAKFVIRNPALLRILAPFRKAPNQVGSSPLSLRSAYSANYSEVQALKNRIAELINENQRLKDQYDQQNGHDKVLYDELQARHDNLSSQLNNLITLNFSLNTQNINLTNRNGALTNRNYDLTDYKNTLLGLRANALNAVNVVIGYINGTNDYAGMGHMIPAGITRANLQNVINSLQNNVLPLINNV